MQYFISFYKEIMDYYFSFSIPIDLLVLLISVGIITSLMDILIYIFSENKIFKSCLVIFLILILLLLALMIISLSMGILTVELPGLPY